MNIRMMPLGAQLVPIMVHEPYLSDNSMWLWRHYLLCGNAVWKRVRR